MVKHILYSLQKKKKTLNFSIKINFQHKVNQTIAPFQTLKFSSILFFDNNLTLIPPQLLEWPWHLKENFQLQCLKVTLTAIYGRGDISQRQ